MGEFFKLACARVIDYSDNCFFIRHKHYPFSIRGLEVMIFCSQGMELFSQGMEVTINLDNYGKIPRICQCVMICKL